MPTPLCIAATEAAARSVTRWSDGSTTLNDVIYAVIYETDLRHVRSGSVFTSSEYPGLVIVEREAAKAVRPNIEIVWNPWIGLGPNYDVTTIGPRLPEGCPSQMEVVPITEVRNGQVIDVSRAQPFWRAGNPLAWAAVGVPLLALTGALVWWSRAR